MTAILLILATTLSFMFLFLNHPLSFGLVLLIETIIVSILTGMMSYNYWFSYILFLIMVGGMLILFMYMTSVASNEKFKFSFSLTFFIISCICVSAILIVADSYLYDLHTLNYDISHEKVNSQMSMSKYINFPTNKIMMMMISYLLITLIMVVKITNVQYGPMRQKF